MGLFRRPVKDAANNVSYTANTIQHVASHIDSLLNRYEKQGFVEVDIVIGQVLNQDQINTITKILGPKLSAITKFFNIPFNIKVKLPPK